jgi:hypothetical protein
MGGELEWARRQPETCNAITYLITCRTIGKAEVSHRELHGFDEGCRLGGSELIACEEHGA